MKQSMQQWITYGKTKNRMLFFYEGKVLDLTQFALYHPGGKKAIANYIFKDITDILFNVFPHKKEQTLNRLFGYIKGTIPSNEVTKRSKVEKSPAKQKKKVCFKRKSDQNESNSRNNSVDKTSPDKKSNIPNKQKPKITKQKDEDRSRSPSPQTTVKSQISPSKSKSKKNVKKKTINKEKQNINKASENEFNKDIQFNSQLDEEKPDFKVPIQKFHYMGQLQR